MNAFTIRVLIAGDEKNLRTVLYRELSDPAEVQAMKLGAYDCLAKPFKTEELKTIVEKTYEKKKILSENLLLKTQIKPEIPGIDPGTSAGNSRAAG